MELLDEFSVLIQNRVSLSWTPMSSWHAGGINCSASSSFPYETPFCCVAPLLCSVRENFSPKDPPRRDGGMLWLKERNAFGAELAHAARMQFYSSVQRPPPTVHPLKPSALAFSIKQKQAHLSHTLELIQVISRATSHLISTFLTCPWTYLNNENASASRWRGQSPGVLPAG